MSYVVNTNQSADFCIKVCDGQYVKPEVLRGRHEQVKASILHHSQSLHECDFILDNELRNKKMDEIFPGVVRCNEENKDLWLRVCDSAQTFLGFLAKPFKFAAKGIKRVVGMQ